MTVKELIEELEKIEDKSLQVNVTAMMEGPYFTHESSEVEVNTSENKVYIW